MRGRRRALPDGECQADPCRGFRLGTLAIALVPLASPWLAACVEDSSSTATLVPPASTINQRLAAERLIGKGDLRMASVAEEAQGFDLDGDGDTLDVVLHFMDLATGVRTNTGLALRRPFLRDEVPPPNFDCNDILAVFQVSELDAGRDLDEDGTPDEVATWIYDRRRDAFEPLPFAHRRLVLGGDLAAFEVADAAGQTSLHVYDGRDAILTELFFVNGGLAAVQDRIVTFFVPELGLVDLDADGDTTSAAVVHIYDADSHRSRSTLFDLASFPVRVSGGFVAFSVSEDDGVGLDLDGDGDTNDLVFVAVGERNGLTRIPGIGDFGFMDILDPDPARYGLAVLEEGLDRNDDGDTQDLVALAYDPRSNRTFDTGLAVKGHSLLAGRWLGVPVHEASQGGTDLDGDGTLEGNVLHVYDLETGRTQNLGLSGLFLDGLAEELLAHEVSFTGGQFTMAEFVVWDARTGTTRRMGRDVRSVLGSTREVALLLTREHSDQNGDGDADDFVLELYDSRTRSIQGLGLAWSGGGTYLAASGRGAALVSEAAQGADLNGDGDMLDDVLHSFMVR